MEDKKNKDGTVTQKEKKIETKEYLEHVMEFVDFNYSKEEKCDNCEASKIPSFHCKTCNTFRCNECTRNYAVEQNFPFTKK